MTIRFDSYSSGLMTATTCYRNQPGIITKLTAEGGYALVAVVATVETVAALLFSAMGLMLYPISSTPFYESVRWLDSSSFTLVWALGDIMLNLLLSRLVADEISARFVFRSGNLWMSPPGAAF